METINWKEIAQWSNDRPDSVTIVWDVRYERTMKYHWRKFARGVRRPSRAYVTGYAKRIVKGRMEVVAAIVDPNYGYFVEPSQGIQYVLDQASADKYADLFKHIESKGIEVKVHVL